VSHWCEVAWFPILFFKNPLYQRKILDFHSVVFGWFDVEVVKITTLRSTFMLLSSRSACEVVVINVLIVLSSGYLVAKAFVFKRKLTYSQVNYETRGFPKYNNTPDKIDQLSSNC
jgi:hypothetical protein